MGNEAAVKEAFDVKLLFLLYVKASGTHMLIPLSSSIFEQAKAGADA